MAIVHLNMGLLAPGDIVPTGNFGRLLRELHQGIAYNGRVYVMGMVAKEYLFEVVRRDVRPAAPSRLTCVFACPTEKDAKLYAVENNSDGHLHSYEVEPVDETQPLMWPRFPTAP